MSEMTLERAREILEAERESRRKAWRDVFHRPDHDDEMSQAIRIVLTAYEAQEAVVQEAVAKERGLWEMVVRDYRNSGLFVELDARIIADVNERRAISSAPPSPSDSSEG